MRITSLKIERFGVWEGLSLPKVSRGINVFYGPNEAGKTTLMQFIRACLYGGADEERARYIQMALDGKTRRGEKVGFGEKRFGEAASATETSASAELKRILDGERRKDGDAETKLDAETAARDAARAWIGGAATVSSEFGDHRLERRYVKRDAGWQSAIERKSGFLASEGLINWSGRFYPLPGKKIAESLVVVGPDGTRVGDYFAKSLTCNLDEATYNGVFAIGLDELQRLGALNETEAAQMLYRLSVGVDRGAFVQVFQQIVAERNDLFDAKGKPSILENLIAERDRARRKSGEAAGNLREYARLLEERRAVLEATKLLQERLDKTTRQKRVRELAVQIADLWDERDEARRQVVEMGDVPAVEQSAVDECAALCDVVEETRKKIKEIKNAYRALCDERDAIPVDAALEELAPRVSILEDDLPRLREIDEEVGRLQGELAELNAKLAEEDARVKSARDGKMTLTPAALDAINAAVVAANLAPETRFGANPNGANVGGAGENASQTPVLPNKLIDEGLSFKEVEDFRIPAKAVRRRRLKLKKYREEFEVVKARLNELVERLEQGLTSRSQRNLTEAIEKTGALLSGLRRRVEIERRVAEMTQYRKELERQNKTLAETQAITGAPFYALAAGVVVGGLLFCLSLFGRMELAVGLVGLLATIACIFYKTTVEKKNYQKLEDNQRRLGLLTRQLEQAQAETKKLDERFPAAPNSTATLEARLQKAKTDLAFFESLAPVEAQWREATKIFRAEEARVKKAEEALKKARKRWTAWLRDAGLPATLKPTQVRDLLDRVGLTEDLRRQIEGVAAEIDFLGRERQGIVDRFAAAVALLPKLDVDKDATPFELAPKLRAVSEEYGLSQKRRAELWDSMVALKKEYRQYFLARRRQTKDVRRFLAGYRVKTTEALVEAVERYATYRRLNAEFDEAQRRLEVGIGGFCSEEELGALLLDAEVRSELPTAIENLERRLESLDAELRGKLELSGRLGQQADAIAAKKESIRSRFEAAALDLRIAEMADLWQSRAIAGRAMEDVRRAYERERQPETLREASRYLRRLTESRYVNIWTPLGEDALYVDAADGETLDVASLSRGTREQLFIAIRLALVVSFEKHGIQMPLILDDVLVNFDNKRAGIAAKVLCDFAKSGRQIFLFTCHEHICRLFLGLNVPVCALPTSNDPKRRAFRVLLPPKSKRRRKNPAETLVSVASEKTDAGPNFATSNPSADAEPSIDVAGAANSGAYRTLEPGEKPTPPSTETESAPAPNEKPRKPYWVVDGSDDEETALKLNEDAENLQGALSVGGEENETAQNSTPSNASEANEPVAEAEKVDAAVEPSVPDFSSFVFSANASEPTEEEETQTVDAGLDSAERAAQVAEYVETLKNVALDGERVELRALSEISPTFSASETAESALEVAPEANVVDVASADAEENEDEDGEDAIESLEYDEWATVFLADAETRADSDDEADSETDGDSFLNYFDEINDEEEEEEEDWEDEEEYGDEEEFDDDADGEEDEFDENDDFDGTDDE
ncbi:MAG: AAA family ATPase [Thermoguttaceae bacterium]|nr:AAA family ATPase [Thermoguttaceae bacterium]